MSRVLSYCPIVTHLHGISECGRVRQRKEEEEEEEENRNPRKINCTKSLSLTYVL